MTQNTINEIKALAEKYKRFGVTFGQLMLLAEKAPPELSEPAVITGIRMILANEYRESEVFTAEQVAACTGETVQEVKHRIKAMGIKVQYTNTAPNRLYS